MNELLARDIITEKTVTADAEARIGDVMDKIRENRASHVIVYDDDRFLGVVPLHSAFMRDPHRIFADLIPRERLPEIPPFTPVPAIAQMFSVLPVDAVKVVEEGGVFLGIVSQDGLLRALLRQTQNRLDEMSVIMKGKVKGFAREKEVMLKEIHHRVKNNLQIVSSLLNLQLNEINDPDAAGSLKACIDRIRSIALVHEKLYRTGMFSDIGFGEYIKSLVNNLFCIYGRTNISTAFVTADVRLSMENAIPCGLIINELITNCLKHAFPDNREGNIEVRLISDNDSGLCVISVRDNGVGLPADLDFKKAGTPGFLLINLLASQVRGEIGLSNAGGTEFILSFPPTESEGARRLTID